MMRASRIALLLATAIFTMAAAPAFAAPVALENVDVTFIEEQGSTLLMVAGQLPETAKLPAQIELGLPAGSKLQWAGELVSSDGSGDFEVKYKKRTTEGTDLYTMTLTKSRMGQVEAIIPPITQTDGTDYVTDAVWTPFANVPEARISVRVPARATITQVGQAETGRLFPADQNYSYFSKTVTDIKKGTPVTLQFAYALSAAPAGATGDGGSSWVFVILILGIAIVGFAFAATAIRKKTAAAEEDAEDDEVGDEGDSDPESDEDGDAVDDDSTPPEATRESDLDTASADADDAEADASDSEDDSTASTQRSGKPIMVLLAVVAVAVVFGVVAGNRSTTAQNVGGALTRAYGTGDACTQASIAYKAAQGVDVQKQGDAILSALEAVPGIGSATILPDTGVIEIGYCSSSATEADLRAVLNSTGLVAVEAAATPAQ